MDVHCHVLPGVDDGAPDVVASLRMLRLAAASGTAAIVATPHQHSGRYPNRRARLEEAFAELTEAADAARAAGETLPELALGAEVHLDSGLAQLVEAGERLRLAGGRYLLLELPDVFPLGPVEHLIFDLQIAGVVPVLAHPERIPQLLRQPEQLARLVERGALGQVTGSSVSGAFGAPCREATWRLLRAGLAHVVASDAHDLVRRTTSLRAAHDALCAGLGPEAARSLLVERPRAILEDRTMDLPPPASPEAEAPAPRGLLARLRERLGSGPDRA